MSEIITNFGTSITTPRWEYVAPHQEAVGSITDSLEEKIAEMLKRLAPPEYTELRCRECGGEIDQKWDDHIVKCPYCRTVYAIGRKLING